MDERNLKEFLAMTLSDFLTQDDAGYIHVTGHRVGLGDIVFCGQRQGTVPL
jgi:hypothetical protein